MIYSFVVGPFGLGLTHSSFGAANKKGGLMAQPIWWDLGLGAGSAHGTDFGRSSRP